MNAYDTLIACDTLYGLTDTISVSVANGLSVETVEPWWKLPLDIILSVLTLAAASFAVFISARALKQDKKHNSALIRPLLIFRPANYNSFRKVKLTMSNKGVGPLVFTKFEMYYKRKCYKKFLPLVTTIVKENGMTMNDLSSKSFSLQLKDYPLKAEESKTLISYEINTIDEEENRNVKSRAREIYKSLLEVKFVYTYENLYHEKVVVKDYKLKTHFS